MNCAAPKHTIILELSLCIRWQPEYKKNNTQQIHRFVLSHHAAGNEMLCSGSEGSTMPTPAERQALIGLG